MGAWLTIVQSLLAAGGVALLVRPMSRLRGTTLVGPCLWVGAALAVLAAAGVFLSLAPDHSLIEPLRLIYATGTFCPLMAVLGARRPHHRAWNFIVASLWIVAALPALEAIFLGRGEMLDIGAVRGWFLWLMIVLGILNYLPTRHAMSAAMVATGQLLLLSGFLPGVGDYDPANGLLGASLLFLSAIVLAIWISRGSGICGNEFDTRWREFRDAFGALWGVRILERINAAARAYNWPFSLSWTGFYFHEAGTGWSDVSPQVEQELQQTMDNLLRRFGPVLKRQTTIDG